MFRKVPYYTVSKWPVDGLWRVSIFTSPGRPGYYLKGVDHIRTFTLEQSATAAAETEIARLTSQVESV